VRSSVIVALPFVLALSACNQDSEAPGKTEAALTSDGGAGNLLSCSMPPNTDQCSGPWQFIAYKDPCLTDVLHNDARCPKDQANSKDAYYTYPYCRNHDFGVDHYENPHYSPGLPYHYVTSCSKYGCATDDGCCVHVKTRVVDNHDCHAIADSYLHSLQAAAGSDYAYFMGVYDEVDPVNNNDITCKFGIYNNPIFNYSTGPQCGQGSYHDAVTVYLDCRLSNIGGCGDDGYRYSDPNLSLTQLQAKYKAPASEDTSSTHVDIISKTMAPVCMTCENYKLIDGEGDDAKKSVQDLATCLLSVDPSVLTQPMQDQVRTNNVWRAKLLLEERGELLSDTQRQSIEALYGTRAGITPACAGTWNPLPPSSDCVTALGAAGTGAFDQVNADLEVCVRLADPHAPQAVRDLYRDRCLFHLSDELNALPDACAKSTAVTRFEQLTVDWLKLAFTNAGLDFSDPTKQTQNFNVLQTELAVIDKWYRETRVFYGTDQDSLRADTSKVLGAFWSGVHASVLGTIGQGSGATSAQALRNATALGLTTDSTVIRALYTPVAQANHPPLTAAPLLTLTGDALQSMWDKLTAAILYHDLGCRFAGCAVLKRSDEVSDLWELLSQLHDVSQLQLLTAKFTNNTSAVKADWQPVFNQLVTGHVALEQAVLDAYPPDLVRKLRKDGSWTYGPELLTVTDLTVLPVEARPVARLVYDATTKTTNFKNLGALSGDTGQVLSTGIQRSQIDTTNQDFTGRATDLSAALTKYDSDRATLVSGLVAQANNKATQQSINDKLSQLQDQYNDNDQRIRALQKNDEIDELRFGDFAKEWAARVSSLDAGAPAQTHSFLPMHLAPQGRGDNFETALMAIGVLPPAGSDAPVNSFGVVRYPLKKGEMLQISVGSQQWAPTCALSTYTWPNNAFGGKITVDATSMTGPEGFQLTNTGSSYRADSHSKTSSNDNYSPLGDGDKSVTGCINSKFGVSYSVIAVAELTVTASACMSGTWGGKHNEVDSTGSSDGDEFRSAATFASGIRVPTTPFPDFPAGSLLLVAVSKDNLLLPASRVQVLRTGNSAFVAPEDSDVYLVVNDKSGCGTVGANQGGLDVTVTQVTPLSNIAKPLGETLGKELAGLRASTPTYVNTRTFTPDNRASLASAALDDLHAALPQAVIPPDLLSLYTSRVDYELSRISRAVEVSNLKRSQITLNLQIQELGNELMNAKDQSRLLELVPAWTLRNLDGDQLRAKVEWLAQLMSANIYPIIKVRYPRLLTLTGPLFTSGKLIPELDNLVNVDWRAELYDQATLVSQAATALSRVYTNEVNHGAAIYTTPLVISIPRQSEVKICNDPATAAFCQLSVYHQVDPIMAQKMWDDIDAGREAAFTIGPEDAYSANGGPSVLDCSAQMSPIAQGMQLFFNVGATQASYTGNYTAPFKVVGDLLFETEEGALRMSLNNDDWLRDPAHLLFDQAANVGKDVDDLLRSPSIHAGTAEGLSPFTAFKLNMSYFHDSTNAADPKLTDLKELLVVFEIEYRDGNGVRGVSSCGH
jgi:hypothetical protein